MIVRVAVLPQPPLLVPELVAGQDAEVRRVRAECLAAAGRLAQAAPRWVAVAADPAVSNYATVVGPLAAGTFRGYGVDVPVRLSAAAMAYHEWPACRHSTILPMTMRSHSSGTRR